MSIFTHMDFGYIIFKRFKNFFILFQELAKDSAKYRSKKERKEQKSSFRDILKTIEEDQEFYEKVAFSKRETLEITSWSMKKQYDQMCKVMRLSIKVPKY